MEPFANQATIVAHFASAESAGHAINDLARAGIDHACMRSAHQQRPDHEEHLADALISDAADETEVTPASSDLHSRSIGQFFRRLLGLDLGKEDSADWAEHQDQLLEGERYFQSLGGGGGAVLVVEAGDHGDLVEAIVRRHGGLIEGEAAERLNAMRVIVTTVTVSGRVERRPPDRPSPTI